MEIISQTLQGGGYLLLLVVLAVLWSTTFRLRSAGEQAWQAWGLLALAWTINLLGNVAWVVHDLVTDAELSTFSIVDLFYFLRYVLIGIALWLYPVSLNKKSTGWMGAAAVIVGVFVWTVYFPVKGGDWVVFLGLAMYPMLDIALIVLAWLRVRAARESSWYGNALLLFLAMACYGIANTLNLTSYVFSVMADGILPNIFWLSTDIFLLVMALGGGVRKIGEEKAS